MAEVQQQSETPTADRPKRKILRSILYILLFVLVFVIAALAVMVSTDKGSKFLLDRVLDSQKTIQYEYEGGNLLHGIILKNVQVNLSSVDVKIDRADVALGWRAILYKEIHLYRAELKNLQVLMKGPPSTEAFKFEDIRLPFILRLDQANLDHLLIETSSHVKVEFSDLHLEDALWEDTKLKFNRTHLDMGYLKVSNARGFMDFSHQGKYPLFARADLNIPALNDSLNIDNITVIAKGSLDTLQAGFATKTPDMLTGWGVIHPVRDAVPMKGQLKLNRYHLPFLTEQKLFAEKGQIDFAGNIHRLNLELNTDLSGQDIPKGQYSAVMNTDLVHQLNINHLNAQILQASINLAGVVNWEKALRWDVKGQIQQGNWDKKLIPAEIKDFLPANLDGKVAVAGHLDQGLQLKAMLDFKHYEKWNATFSQKQAQGKSVEPMLLNLQWQKMNRALPYIGWLNSPQGEAKIKLLKQQQNIQLATQVVQHEKSLLPKGNYQAQLSLKNNDLNISSFIYADGSSRLKAKAVLKLPHDKQQLKWNAELDAQQFNPHAIIDAAPINWLNGRIKANGYAKPNQQIIHFNAIDLTGRLVDQNETVKLTGKSTLALIFQDEKAGGAFKSFAVDYAGALKASSVPASQGYLKAVVAGTPNYIRIQQLYHDGAAGKIAANGMLNLKQGISWDLNTSLVHFKPHYFVQGLTGEISGVVRTQGIWSDVLKKVSVSQLNLAGTLNNKPIRGRGNLALILDARDQGLLPQKFEANNLFLAYAHNKMQASGNAQSLKIKIDAPALNEIYSGLKGRIYGYLDVQSQPRLKAIANLAIDQLSLNNLFSIKQIRIQGELPTSETRATQLIARLDSLRKDNREIQQAQMTLEGTRRAHILKLSAENKYSQFYVQLAGGFNAQNDWLGQIQKGDFDSFRTHLTQVKNASVIYDSSKAELLVGVHCWASKNSQLCFDQPIRVSANAGNISFVTQNLDLDDFSAFMPEGLAITGKVNGFAKASWRDGHKPDINVRVITRNGKIGLSDEDSGGVTSSLSYEQVALLIRSVEQGLQLRLDVKTPAIGTGYANVVIDPYSEDKDMKGEVAFNDVDLKVFKPFIPDVRKLGGILSFAGKVNGSLSQPLMTGDMRLKNGEISMLSLPVNLTNIQVYSAIRQDSAKINGAFNSGAGVGYLTGHLDWQDELKILLNLKGDNLLIRQAPLVTALVKPDIALEAYPMQKKIKVNGQIFIPKALISMPEATEPVISVSPDARVVYAGQDQLAILKAAKPWHIETKIDLKLGDQVVFKGLGSRFPLAGRLYLSQVGTETAMRANGAIGVAQRVKFEAYGQSLELTRAIARFNGPLENPSLDLDANKTIQGSIVGVRVSGTASAPHIQIYNNAGLSEQESVNALLTGRINSSTGSIDTTAGFKSDVNNTIAAAGLSMGLGGTRALTNQIGQTFGLSGLALDAQGQGDDTQVSLTGYITPDLYLRYGVGVFSSVNTLTMRYQLNKRLYLEASQSLEKAIDFFYNWKF